MPYIVFRPATRSRAYPARETEEAPYLSACGSDACACLPNRSPKSATTACPPPLRLRLPAPLAQVELEASARRLPAPGAPPHEGSGSPLRPLTLPPLVVRRRLSLSRSQQVRLPSPSTPAPSFPPSRAHGSRGTAPR